MKKALLGIIILMLFCCIAGCAKHTRIRNKEFNNLLKEISDFDSVTRRSSAYFANGPRNIYANFYVNDSFTKYDEMKIFYLIRDCLSVNISQIMLDLKLSELPDIEVMMRVEPEKGYFAVTYYASIYATPNRTGKPDFDHYIWTLENYYERLSKYDEDTLKSLKGGAPFFWINRARVIEKISDHSIIVEILPMLVQGAEQVTDKRQDVFSLIDGDRVMAVFDSGNISAVDMISSIDVGSVVNIARYAIPILEESELDFLSAPIVVNFNRIDVNNYWTTDWSS